MCSTLTAVGAINLIKSQHMKHQGRGGGVAMGLSEVCLSYSAANANVSQTSSIDCLNPKSHAFIMNLMGRL